MNILLVEPDFPIPNKSKNHSSFLPIGLLKLASYYRNKGDSVILHRGNIEAKVIPDMILITSLFTYWSIYVKNSVSFYKSQYPNAKVIVGGIYASLMPQHCLEFTGCDEVFVGQHAEADKLQPSYEIVDVDYQIIHGMRGCTRKCSFCGIWRLEPKKFKTATQIKNEILFNKLVFYDNNFLANPNIESILKMLSEVLINNKVVHCDCQSGFDGRIIERKPHLVSLLKKARFSQIRVAWDFDYLEFERVKLWIDITKQAGYSNRNIFVFMIYNWDLDFNHMELKRQKCFEWGIQIADCRYRPLNQTYDFYNGNKPNQDSNDYYIHPKWTDQEIKLFRKNVRQHNICIRYNIPWDNYSKKLELLNARKNRKFELV